MFDTCKTPTEVDLDVRVYMYFALLDLHKVDVSCFLKQAKYIEEHSSVITGKSKNWE